MRTRNAINGHKEITPRNGVRLQIATRWEQETFNALIEIADDRFVSFNSLINTIAKQYLKGKTDAKKKLT